MGGLELYATKLSNFLSGKVNLTAVIDKNSQLVSYFLHNKKPVYQVKKSILSAIKIAKIIDKNSIDIIHVHWTKDLPIAVLAKLLSKKKPKLIQTRHMGMTRFKNDFYHRFIYKNTDLIIAVTKQVKSQIEKFITPIPKVVLSYIGTESPSQITPSTFIALKEKYQLTAKFIVCIVGRIEHEKGQHIAIDALAKLVKQGVDVQLLIVGGAMTQTYLQELKQDITNRALSNKIIFTGFVTNAGEFIQLSDVLILATRKETFGLVLVEAMQAGVCVIASDKGGPLEIIEHEKTGLLFKSFDVDDLYEKILTLYQNPDLKCDYAKAAKIQAEKRFDAQKQFNEVLEIYHSL